MGTAVAKMEVSIGCTKHIHFIEELNATRSDAGKLAR